MTPRRTTALVAVLFLPLTSFPAACASARAADALPAPAAVTAPASPFPVVPLRPSGERRSHLGAYTVMAAGLGCAAASYVWQRRANDLYDEYLAATEPDAIASLFDRTAHYDRLSSASLIGGEALFAAGVWMRFLWRPSSAPVTLELGPRRCALALRF